MAKFRSTTDVVPAVYKPGEKFAQLLILPCVEASFIESIELSDSDRGEDGYGSTDNANNENNSAPTGSTDSQNIVENKDQQTAPEEAAGEVNTPEQAQ